MTDTERQRIGQDAEDRACRYLTQQGMSLRERNYRCRYGEIDLIMQDKQHLVFVEVRCRSDLRFGSAAETVDAGKQRKLITAASHYLQKKGLSDRMGIRFDVIAVHRRGWRTDVDWIPNAFDAI